MPGDEVINPPVREKTMTVYFYMRGGSYPIATQDVVEVTMGRGGDGSYDSYTIRWAAGKQPPMFTLSIPDIIAVTTSDLL